MALAIFECSLIRIFVYSHEVHPKRYKGFMACRAYFDPLSRSPLKVKYIMLEMISFLSSVQYLNKCKGEVSGKIIFI